MVNSQIIRIYKLGCDHGGAADSPGRKISESKESIAEGWLVLNPFMVAADLYHVTPNSGHEMIRSGTDMAVSQRDIVNVRPIIRLTLQANQSHIYYMRVKR